MRLCGLSSRSQKRDRKGARAQGRKGAGDGERPENLHAAAAALGALQLLLVLDAVARPGAELEPREADGLARPLADPVGALLQLGERAVEEIAQEVHVALEQLGRHRGHPLGVRVVHLVADLPALQSLVLAAAVNRGGELDAARLEHRAELRHLLFGQRDGLVRFGCLGRTPRGHGREAGLARRGCAGALPAVHRFVHRLLFLGSSRSSRDRKARTAAGGHPVRASGKSGFLGGGHEAALGCDAERRQHDGAEVLEAPLLHLEGDLAARAGAGQHLGGHEDGRLAVVGHAAERGDQFGELGAAADAGAPRQAGEAPREHRQGQEATGDGRAAAQRLEARARGEGAGVRRAALRREQVLDELVAVGADRHPGGALAVGHQQHVEQEAHGFTALDLELELRIERAPAERRGPGPSFATGRYWASAPAPCARGRRATSSP